MTSISLLNERLLICKWSSEPTTSAVCGFWSLASPLSWRLCLIFLKSKTLSFLISLNLVCLPLWKHQKAKVPKKTNIIYPGREHKTNHNTRAINIHTEFNYSVFNQSKRSKQRKSIQNHKYTKSEVLNIAKIHSVEILTNKKIH